MGAHVRSLWGWRKSLGDPSGWLIAVAVGLTLAAVVVGAAPTVVRSAPAPLRLDTPTSLSNLTLAVSPGSWRMPPGATASFVAAPVDIPSECTVGPLAMTWSLPGWSQVDGYLNRSAGPSVSYHALSPGGNLDLHVVAFVLVTCGATVSSVEVTGDAFITIFAPVLASGFLAEPDPTSPGGPVLLQWSVDGGLPPYTVSLVYGDGSRAILNLPSPGSPFVIHRFAAGQYDPVVTVTDSTGGSSSESLPEPVLASARLAAGISPVAPTTDPGVSPELKASISGGTAPYLEQWTSNNGGVGMGPDFVVPPWNSGTVNVSLVVFDAAGSVATATAQVVVEPSPAVVVVPTNASSDVGRPMPAEFNVTGGVGPFTLDWQVVPGGPNGSAVVSRDGTFVEPVVPASTGPVWVQVSVTDALGIAASAAGPVGAALLPPTVTIAPSAPVTEVGRPFAVSASVVGGSPPVVWSLASSIPTANPSGSDGPVGPGGSVSWTGSFVAPGNTSVSLYVVDASGASSVASATVRVLPALSAHAAALGTDPRVGTALPVGVEISGGEPPYAYLLELSDGERLSGTASVPGALLLNASPSVPGYLTVSLNVSDALGASSEAQTTAVIAAAALQGPSPAPPTSAPAVAGAAAEVTLGAGAVGLLVAFPVLRRRLRGGRRASPGDPAALGWVRRKLRGGDGLDRGMLDLLAVEEGVDAAAVERAVAAWERAGRVRSTPGDDGEVRLTWDDPSGRGDPIGPGGTP